MQEATLAVDVTPSHLSRRGGGSRLLSASTTSGASATSRGLRALRGLAWVEFWAGRWALGAEYATRARDISVQYGLEVPQDLLPIAVIAVHRGQLELAREHSNWRSSSRKRSSACDHLQRGGRRARRTLEWRSFPGDRLAR